MGEQNCGLCGTTECVCGGGEKEFEVGSGMSSLAEVVSNLREMKEEAEGKASEGDLHENLAQEKDQQKGIEFRFFKSLDKGNSVCLCMLPAGNILLYPTVYKVQRVRRNGTLVLKPSKSLEDKV